MNGPTVELWFTTGTPDGAKSAIEEVFQSEGIATKRSEWAPPPVGNGVGWYLVAAVGYAGLQAFFNGYFGAAGADAWRRTQAFVRRLRQRYDELYPGQPPGAVLELELVDAETDARVFLGSDLPDEAFRKLFELEFDADSWYVWDVSRGEWVKRPPGGFRAFIRPGFRNWLRRLFRRR